MTQQRKAIALISGGLDSMLAAKVIMEQGIHVEGINFYTGFCHSGHTSAIRKQKHNTPKRNDALWVAEQLGIKLHIVDIVEEYKQILTNPSYGYGAHFNPCLDCKVFMVKKAVEWMEEHKFDFIITGEVIGQRPMSQRKDTMPVVANQSGASSRLLRPLCAKNLPPTLPEEEKWIDREKLFNFGGRGRRPQIALAEQFGIEEYAQPSGGCCVLTDKSYCQKLADLWKSRGEKSYDIDDIILLKVGRHLRPTPDFKLIIAREEGETNFLEGYRKRFTHLRITSHRGPLILIDGTPSQEDLYLAARISARFSQGRDADEVQVLVEKLGGGTENITVKPMLKEDIPLEWYL